MLSTRYSLIIANRRTGVVRRLTLSLRPVVVVGVGLCVLVMLMVLGASRKAAWQRASLESELSALRAENETMRSATGALTSQITSLQSVVDDISKLSPSATERTAMGRLPKGVQQSALGGLSPEAARIALTGPTAQPDAVGVVRQMLSALESRLETARPRLERRAALARATPAIWPALGALSSSFGTRRDPFTAAASMHPGLDLDVDLGDPVFATADGVVTDARYHPEYGNLVIVSHGFGIETRYAHLSRYRVRPGTSVTRGQVVGEAGSTGRSTGSHLHYEVWIDGRPVNPLQYLVARDAR
ncbi:peptidase M24 [Luteitalea sp. TBR-22]|uniref:M23 family metallopeptidase n=1 Tax=Luteitalea sp. TBR-22 TaxID=2802971 RepID=UPI001AF7281F|nr:M23 family metallopeptidase [Luteitalea sp. TBR-22]BCS33327.1 peptidase M24 [Luteitalea sp. TBR-22]